MNGARIPVTVIGGYLGAGKTTLVNHILATADERIAVLVNDFGAINIDKDLIVGSDGAAVELANGCICCSLADGLVSALDLVLSRSSAPDRVLIEASGVADPAAVAAYGHRPGLSLDATIVLADACSIGTHVEDPYVGDTVRAQLAAADIVVLTKTDVAGQETIESGRRLISELNRDAPTIPATNGAVSLEALFGIDQRPSSPTPGGVAPAATSFETTSLSFETPIDHSTLREALDALPPEVVRAKGIVRLSDQPSMRAVVQRVGVRLNITTDGPWPGGPSRLVFVGISGTGLGFHPLFRVNEVS
jgi:G3E family GTPase